MLVAVSVAAVSLVSASSATADPEDFAYDVTTGVTTYACETVKESEPQAGAPLVDSTYRVTSSWPEPDWATGFGPATTVDLATGSFSFDVGTPEPGVTYRAEVRCNYGNPGEQVVHEDAAVHLSTVAMVVPTAPRDVVALPGDGSALVGWTAPESDGGSPVTGYTVTASDGTSTCTATPPSTSCTVVGLTNGTEYTFEVVATNEVGDSDAARSNPVTPAAPDAGDTVPAAPTDVTAVAGDGSADVTWTAPADDGGSPVTGYQVTASDGTSTCLVAAPSTGCTVHGLVNGTAYTFTVVAINLVGSSAPSAPSDPVTPTGPSGTEGSRYVPLDPTRILDTRSGLGAPDARVGAGRTVALQVTDVAGVPADDVTAVVLNVTAAGPSEASFITVYPEGQARPFASNLNTYKGVNEPNLVVVKVGTDGKVRLFNQKGSTDLVADLAGYYTDAPQGSDYVPLDPTRVLDTRRGLGAPEVRVQAGTSVPLQVTGVAGVPTEDVTAVVLNVTAAGPSAASFVTVYPEGQTRPFVSNLNTYKGVNEPNLVVVKVGTDGKVRLFNQKGSTDLVADIAGYYTDGADGSAYVPLDPTRVLDTRRGLGAPDARVQTGRSVPLQVTGVAGVPAADVTAVVLNVTAAGPSAASFITVYPEGQTRPFASNLNTYEDINEPNLVVVKVGSGGLVRLYNSLGSTDLVADIAGYYTD